MVLKLSQLLASEFKALTRIHNKFSLVLKPAVEIRFALDRKIKSKRLKASVPLSKTTFKNCFDLKTKEEIDNELIGWIKESYYLKD